MKTTTSLVTLGCALLLSACGGGGGGGGGSAASSAPPPTSTLSTITAANAPLAASNGYNGSALISQSSSSLTGIVTGVSVAPANIGVVTPVLDLVKQALGRTGGALPAGVTVSEACSGGGTVTIDATLRDQNTLSNGDTLAITTKNCVESGSLLNGSLSITVSGVTGDPINGTSGAVTLQTRFNGFSVALGSVLDTMNGDMKISLSVAGASGATLAISGASLQVTEQKNGASLASRTLTDYSLSGTLRGTTISAAANFTLTGSSNGLGQFSYTVKNLQPFVGVEGGMPTSGAMIVNGNNSSVTVTVTGANTVRLDYSAKGDGVITQTSTLSWNDFLASL